jgi:hypothetical protein
VKIAVDCETVGLCGPVKLIQYSVDRGPVQFIKLPKGHDNGNLLGVLYGYLNDSNTTFVGFHTTFDLWHLYRLLKPKEAFKCQVLDLYNHALLKGPFAPWAFNSRGKPVAAVRKLPRVAADIVARRVEDRLQPQVPGPLTRHLHEIKGRPDLVSISWSANVSMGLKALAEYWGAPVIKLKDVWPLPSKDEERPWLGTDYDNAAYAQIEDECDKVLAQDERSDFYTYARNDIEYLWLVEDKLGSPTPDYNDTSTHVVAYTRYIGYAVDRDVLQRTEKFYDSTLRGIELLLNGCDLKSHQQRTALLKKYNPIIQSSKKEVLQALAKIPDECGTVAGAMLKYGSAKQKLDQVKKVLQAGHFHVDLRTMGTATLRKAGTSALNAQGIGKVELDESGQRVGLREAVHTRGVGDFAMFELAIAAAAWSEDNLLRDLRGGIDVHLATAVDCHPRLVGKLDYKEAKKAKKQEDHPLHVLVKKCRDECKRMVFGILYGCTESKIAEVFGVSIEEALQILQRFYTRYPGIKAYKEKVEARFCTADTEGWTLDSVAKMDDSETDLTGAKRQWRFEKQVACVLWEMGNRFTTTGLVGSIVRQSAKGAQSIDQACRSALLGAAIAIQQAVFRQAANCKIQMTGAVLCKKLEAELWDAFRIPMLNVHDEIVFGDHAAFDFNAICSHVDGFIDCHKHLVEHLRFDISEARRWSHKG